MRLLIAGSAAIVQFACATVHSDTQSSISSVADALPSTGLKAEAADAILTANRAAVGDPPPRSVLTLVYRYVSSGLTGTLTDRVDLATGAYVETRDLSGVTDGEGFDGKTPWQRDISGTRVELTARRGDETRTVTLVLRDQI